MISLPGFDGKYQVGFVDFETKHTDTLNHGTLFRVFYPTEKSKPKSYWLPKAWYAIGYGHFIKMPSIVSYLFFAPALSWVRTPAVHNAPVHPQLDEFPVVVFSHGLGGMRTTYSNLCGNLAAKGCIVVSIEHADGSGSYTFRNNYSKSIPYEHPDKTKVPAHETEDEYYLRWRKSHIQHRVAEVKATVDWLNSLQAGEIKQTDNVVHETFEWSQFKGKLNLKDLILMGHSFGAATALASLEKLKGVFRAAVVLDPWMHAVKEVAGPEIPYLNMQSEKFHWRENLQDIKNLHSRSKNAKFGFIRDTAHQDLSDFPLIYPSVIKRTGQSGDLDPKTAHLVYDTVITEYLSQFVKLAPQQTQQVDAHRVFGDEAMDYLFQNLKK
ncbi:platelet-activating factor acetylhydrolase [Gorgonomyces haynaldii]|nr:platelet-activating factor acetylhydrolase [Gorgonomyces haynaldii]